MFDELIKLPNLITAFRFVLVPVLWTLALGGLTELVGFGILLGGLSDAVDGYLARRLDQVSEFGSKFDSIADQFLQLSAIGWIFILQPEIFSDNSALSLIALATYLLSLLVGIFKFRRIANLHLYLSKIAAVFLFTFVVHAFIAGQYSPVLFLFASAGFILSSAETLVLQLISDSVDEHMGSLLFVLSSRRSSSERPGGKELTS